MNEKLKEALQKIPVVPIVAVIAGYLGYDYYSFMTDASSPLIQKQQQVEGVKKQNADLENKLKQAEEFFRSLDQKRNDLRVLALQLDALKASLSEDLDIPAFIKMINTEANKTGLAVLGIKPGEFKRSEYYVEQAFEMDFRGVYLQLLVFLERLANLERIVRTENITMRPVSSQTASYVELEGKLQLKTYKYQGSKADELLKANAPPQGGGAPPQGTAPAPGTTAPAQPEPAPGGGK